MKFIAHFHPGFQTGQENCIFPAKTKAEIKFSQTGKALYRPSLYKLKTLRAASDANEENKGEINSNSCKLSCQFLRPPFLTVARFFSSNRNMRLLIPLREAVRLRQAGDFARQGGGPWQLH